MKNHGTDGKVSGAEPHIAVGTKGQPRANAVITAEAIDRKKGGPANLRWARYRSCSVTTAMSVSRPPKALKALCARVSACKFPVQLPKNILGELRSAWGAALWS